MPRPLARRRLRERVPAMTLRTERPTIVARRARRIHLGKSSGERVAQRPCSGRLGGQRAQLWPGCSRLLAEGPVSPAQGGRVRAQVVSPEAGPRVGARVDHAGRVRPPGV
eukprot:15817190-Heterocapsa_arctica.AAC.1